MGWSIDDVPDMAGRVAVITGANGGLGFETARALARKGATIVMAVRDAEKGARARGAILAETPGAALEIARLDVSSLASVHEAAAAIVTAHRRLDILVNNAGVMAIPRRESPDGHELQLATSHLGHFALTALLMPAILQSDRGRVVSVTSLGRLLGRPLDSTDISMRRRYNPWLAYGRAKLAVVQFTVALDGVLEACGAPVRALAADPGFSRTDLQARCARETGGISQRFAARSVAWFGSSPAAGALPQIRCAVDPATSGGCLYGLRYAIAGPPVRQPYLVPWLRRQDLRALWAISERETGVRFDVATMAGEVSRQPAA